MAETVTVTETETEKIPPQRPIVRLGIFLISHSLIVSVLCCVAAVVNLLLLPVLAKNTYISENALLPGSASSMISNEDVSSATRLMQDIQNLGLKPGIETQKLIAHYMSDLAAEVSYHKFPPHRNQFHPLHFFSSPSSEIAGENFSSNSYGVNTVGIIRAPRGDGKESIVLVTPYNSLNNSSAEALSLGVAYSVFSLLSRVTWLAKDIIWLVADSRYDDCAPVTAWLRDYYTPVFSGEENMPDGFIRGGTMAAALVVKVADDNNRPFEDTLSVYAEASNGQMPNLDLINVLVYLAVHRQGLHVKIEKLWSLLESKWVKFLGELFESLGNVARSLNPQWKFGISASDYVDGTATLASSLYYQALGIPTGPHGAFRDYQIDAITLEISPKFSSNNLGRQKDFILRGGRVIEGTIRSVNNLLEKFHQSFFLYLLTSPSKFVSVGVYMIAFALLVAPLPMVAASLYTNANNLDPRTPGNVNVILKSWKWLNAAKKVFVVHLWGLIVSLLPYFISQVQNSTPTTSFLIWIFLSILSFLVLQVTLSSPSHREPNIREWAILKSVTISATFIGLCLMSVINFATAEIGALFIVPLCLLCHPLNHDIKSLKKCPRAIFNLVFVFLAFPPAAFFVLKGVSNGFVGVDVADFWLWLESLWTWNSATYLYMGMVHLPCWVLCVHILLYRF